MVVTDCDEDDNMNNDDNRRYGGDDENTNAWGHTKSKQARTSDVLIYHHDLQIYANNR